MCMINMTADMLQGHSNIHCKYMCKLPSCAMSEQLQGLAGLLLRQVDCKQTSCDLSEQNRQHVQAHVMVLT
jgi:hypothetical protein